MELCFGPGQAAGRAGLSVWSVEQLSGPITMEKVDEQPRPLLGPELHQSRPHEPVLQLHEELKKRDVLRQVFPTHVAASLERGERVQPQFFRDVYVLFADIIDYTKQCKSLSPLAAHCMLEEFYLVLDYCLSLFPALYKVETIGDCVMCIGGAPIHLVDTTSDIIAFAMVIVETVKQLVKNPLTGESLAIRVGIHCGDVVGGVFGLSMPRYTFTGDAVNTASRMQSLSDTNGITVSLDVALAVAWACELLPSSSGAATAKAAVKKLKGVQRGKEDKIPAGTHLSLGGVKLVSRGLEPVKGKGLMQTFALLRDTESVLEEQALESSSLFNSTPRNSSFGKSSPASLSLPKVMETAELLRSDPRCQSICSVSTEDATTVSVSSRSTLSSGLEEDDGKSPDISTRVSRILASSALGSALSKTSGGASEATTPSPLPSLARSWPTPQAKSQFNPAALSILDGLEILLMCDSPTQSKMLCHHLRPINSTWSLRVTSTYSELVRELQVGGFRCDLLLIDCASVWVSGEGMANVITSLQQKWPKFMSCVMTVILSEGLSESDREEEAAKRNVDDCWTKPPAPPAVLQTRLIQVAVTKFLSLSTAGFYDPAVDSSGSSTTPCNTSESESPLSSDVVAQLPVPPLSRHGSREALDGDEFWWPPGLLEVNNAPSAKLRQGAKKKRQKKRMKQSKAEPFSGPGRALSTVGRLLHKSVANKWAKSSSVETPLTMLIVEDSLCQRKIIMRMLQSISPAWTVVGCADDSSAMSELEARDYNVDLIFIDLNLGENSIDGNELTRSLRARLDSKTVIIGISRERKNTERNFLACGADAAWSKPLPPPQSIGARIDSLLLARTGIASILA